MPAGNLCLVHQPSGEIVATGQKTVKQVERTILDHMAKMAKKTTNTDVVSSYQLFTPYKGFGDGGVKAYSLTRKELVKEEPKAEEPQEKKQMVDDNTPVIHEL